MLKNKEADVTYALYSSLGEEVRRDQTLKLEPVIMPGNEWGTFVDMYDPKSPWHDKRVRLAANHAINRQAINDAETLGFSQLSGGIIPRGYDFALRWNRMRMIPRRPKNCSKRQGLPTVLMPGNTRVMRCMRASLKGW